jgi:hypothetical protein
MNSDVHPVVVVLVLALTAAAIAIWMCFSGAAAKVGGPSELRSGPEGHHYVQVRNYLVEHDEDGKYLETHDLDELGVELFLGTFAFFSNGDILLRRGPDPRSFTDNLRAFQRKTNEQSITPDTPDSGLFRCSLSTSACERFGSTGMDFKAAHGIFIDWRNDEVYISDTTRHLLRKYSADGIELAKPVGGFKFPNQLLIHDDQLLVADTNHHAIRAISPDSSSFADVIESFDVVPDIAKYDRQTWPSHFARVGDGWWVNNMRTGMNFGGIYIFNDAWRFDRKVQLPDDADPISLLAVGDNVWVSDWNNDRVRRFLSSGETRPDLDSAGLAVILAESRAERLKFEFLSYGGIALFVLVLLGLVARGVAVSMNKDSRGQRTASIVSTSQVSDSPLFFEPNAKAIRRMTAAVKVLGLLVLMLVGLLIYILTSHDNPEFGIGLIPSVSGLIVIVLLIVWVNKANVGTSIRLHGNMVTLRDHNGRESSCPIRELRYDDSAIATREVIVVLGRPTAWVYEPKSLKDELIPRLEEAKKVGPLEMMRILIELRHPQGLVTVIAIIGLVTYGIWSLGFRV